MTVSAQREESGYEELRLVFSGEEFRTTTSMQGTQSNPTPKVSIIIPSYKTAGLIAACLDSAFAQSYSDFEAIVVNDGSPDTPELEKALAPYIDRIVYVKQENKRCAGARNNAIRSARGEFVAFLDSDDTWMPEHLASQMRLFAEDPKLDLVYCDGILAYESAPECKFMDKNPSHGEATFANLIVERCQIPISSVVARKQALMKAGLFDETLPRCDDYDMWVRAAFHGAKIGYSREVGARFFVGRAGSLSQSKARMIEGYWNILEKFKRTLPLSDADREVVEKRAAQIRARYLLEEGKSKLEEHQFDQGRQLLAEANDYLHQPSLSAALVGLKIAPGATVKFMSFWRRMRNGVTT
ncbi:MAG: glycosyltransferase family 2 protein [Terriglobales bacterium]